MDETSFIRPTTFCLNDLKGVRTIVYERLNFHVNRIFYSRKIPTHQTFFREKKPLILYETFKRFEYIINACTGLNLIKFSLGQNKFMICFSGSAAQTFSSLFSRIFQILSLLVFSIMKSK